MAEEFDRDPFAMLAWRGKDRDELLAALRGVQAKKQTAPRTPGGASATPAGALPGTAAPGLLDVPAPALADVLDTFFSPGLSPARLRALAADPATTPPDLLLRMFPAPGIQVRGQDLGELLAPAYDRLAAPDPEPADSEPGPGPG
jgi:uncharacterized Zn finger protein